MSKDLEPILKIVIKNQDDTDKIITKINRQIKEIDNKINTILEILNNFTLLLLEEEDDETNSETYNSEWIPEQSETWNSYEDDEDEQGLN